MTKFLRGFRNVDHGSWRIALASAATAVGLLTGSLSAVEPEQGDRLANVPSASSQPKFDGVRDQALSDDHKVVAQFAQVLRDAKQKLAAVPSIQCTLHKQERIDGHLADLNVVSLKVRREPLSAYMKWETPAAGQEAIWQQGANDNQVLAHPAGWKRKLVPLVKVDPLSERAMENNRRPINEVGIWNMTQRLLDYAEKGERSPIEGVRANLQQNVKLAGRDCLCFTFIYSKPVPGVEFHKVNVYIDQELGVPIGLQNFGFPKRGAQDLPLEESYVFANLNLNAGLTDLDFSIDNPAYQYNGR